MYYNNQYLQPQKSSFNSYAIPLIVAAHVLSFCFCVTAPDFPGKAFAHVLLGVIFSAVATSATLLYAKSNVPKFIAAFLVATCTLKLPICLIAPDTTFLAVLPLEGKLLAEVVCQKFFWFSIGYLGYSIGAIYASRFFWGMADPAKRDAQSSMPEKGFALLLFVYLSLQSMRAFLLLVLKIGAPNILTRELLIPKLSGILVIFGTRGLLLITTGLLAWALARRSYVALLISALAALAYSGVEAAGGWRSGMYYYALCGSWVFLAAEPSKLKSRLKPFAFGFVALAFLLFIPVMDLRNYLNRGMSHGEALKAVLELRQDDDRDLSDKVHKIIRRFNGIDLFIVAAHGSENKSMGLMSLYNGSASKFFTFNLLGTPDEAVTTQGITYWGAVAIAIGDQWLGPAGVILGIVIGGMPVFCRRWFYTPTLRAVYESNVTIILLTATMGNGAFPLYAKELFISFIVCMLYRLIVSGSQSPAYYSNAQMQYK